MDFKPDAWLGPEGQLMAHVIYEAWAPLYHDQAKLYRPLVTAEQALAMVAAERERLNVKTRRLCEAVKRVSGPSLAPWRHELEAALEDAQSELRSSQSANA